MERWRKVTRIPLEVRRGAATALPLGLITVLLGVSFGVLASVPGGIGALPALVMSATSVAGAAQFAAASIVLGGGQPVAAVGAALLLNARYVPMGVSLAPFLAGTAMLRFLQAQLIVDGSWAIASRGEGRFEVRVLIGAGLVMWLAWVSGTLIGILGGEALGDLAALGLDAAFPALFLVLLVPQLTNRHAVAAALLGASIALVLIPHVPPGLPIIAAAAAALIGISKR